MNAQGSLFQLECVQKYENGIGRFGDLAFFLLVAHMFLLPLVGRRRSRAHRRRQLAGLHGTPQEALGVISGLRSQFVGKFLAHVIMQDKPGRGNAVD